MRAPSPEPLGPGERWRAPAGSQRCPARRAGRALRPSIGLPHPLALRASGGTPLPRALPRGLACLGHPRVPARQRAQPLPSPRSQRNGVHGPTPASAGESRPTLQPPSAEAPAETALRFLVCPACAGPQPPAAACGAPYRPGGPARHPGTPGGSAAGGLECSRSPEPNCSGEARCESAKGQLAGGGPGPVLAWQIKSARPWSLFAAEEGRWRRGRCSAAT